MGAPGSLPADEATASGGSRTPPATGGRALGALAGVTGAVWLAGIVPTWQLSPDLGHAWLAPLLAAYLWWERWGERPGVRAERPLPPAAARGYRSGGVGTARVFTGLGLLALAAAVVPVRLLLTPYPLWPMVVICFTALFAAIVLLAAGRISGSAGVRWVGGPLLLLLSCLPLPSRLETAAILPLRELMAGLAAEICNLVGQPALASGTSIQLANGWVGVEDACSGIRSLQACAMMGLFFGEWFRFGAMKRGLLLLVGAAAAVAGNFGRVLFLSLAATRGAEAVESSHDVAGWVAMLASLAATGWIAFAWGGYRLPATAATTRSPGSIRPLLPWLVAPAAILVATDVGTRAWFARGERAQAQVPQWTAVLPLDRPMFQPRALSDTARQMLRPDRFAAGGWRQGDERVEAYYVEWVQGQAARSIPFLHNPTVCLPYGGCELVTTLPRLEARWAGGVIPFFAYEFRRGEEPLLVAFTIWDPTRGELLQKPATTSWSAWWSNQWADVRDARRHQPAQLLAVSLRTEDSPAARARLLQTIEQLILARR